MTNPNKLVRNERNNIGLMAAEWACDREGTEDRLIAGAWYSEACDSPQIGGPRCPGPDEGDGESGPDMIEPCCPVHFPRFFSVPGVRTFETSADDCVCAYCDETLDECGCDEPLFQL